MTASDQTQHVDLPLGEPSGSADLGRTGGLAGGSEHGLDLHPTEPARVDLIKQLRRGIRPGERGPVGTVLGHGLVRVGGGQKRAPRR